MDNSLELLAPFRRGECYVGELAAIDLLIGRKDARAECSGDLLINRGPRRVETMYKRVGAEREDAVEILLLEHLEDGGLSASDAAGERNAEH